MMRQKLLAIILPLAVAGILGFLFHQKMKTEKERTTTTTWEDDGQVTTDDTAGDVQMDEDPTQNTQDGYSPQQQEKEEEEEDTTDVIDDRVPSDESLLEDARNLTANPILRLALTQEGILRLFVRFVDNAANGVLDDSVKHSSETTTPSRQMSTGTVISRQPSPQRKDSRHWSQHSRQYRQKTPPHGSERQSPDCRKSCGKWDTQTPLSKAS